MSRTMPMKPPLTAKLDDFVWKKWFNDLYSYTVENGVPGSWVSNAAYGSGWNSVTTIAPSKQAVYNQFQAIENRYVAFHVHRNGTDQTGIATGTNTKVQWTNEDFDIGGLGGYFDSSSNYRFTPPSGYYFLHAQVRWTLATAAGENRVLRLYKNGAEIKQTVISGADTSSSSCVLSAVVYANGTDYFEIYVSQNSGSNKDLFGATSPTFFCGHWVAPG